MTESDLLAIAEVVRREVRAEVSDIREDVKVLKEDVKDLKERVTVLERDVHSLKEDVSVLKEDVSVLKEDVSVLKKDVSGLKGDMSALKDRVSVLEKDVKSLNNKYTRLESEVKRNNVILENIVVPRLDTIEACYTDTYERYRKNSRMFETMKSDIELIKLVVTSHSEQLNLVFA